MKWLRVSKCICVPNPRTWIKSWNLYDGRGEQTLTCGPLISTRMLLHTRIQWINKSNIFMYVHQYAALFYIVVCFSIILSEPKHHTLFFINEAQLQSVQMFKKCSILQAIDLLLKWKMEMSMVNYVVYWSINWYRSNIQIKSKYQILYH